MCVNENTENVEDLVFCQEDNPKTHRLNREISCETGIHSLTVRRIIYRDLQVNYGNKSHDVRSPYRIDSFILPSVSSVSDLGVLWIARLNLVSIATNCAPKPVFVLDRFYVVFDASVL